MPYQAISLRRLCWLLAVGGLNLEFIQSKGQSMSHQDHDILSPKAQFAVLFLAFFMAAMLILEWLGPLY